MSAPSSPAADERRRRLTHEESVELLTRPVVGVFSSLAKAGWIHSVPVHFLYRDGEVRILGGTASVKARNVRRTGRATLCVEVTDGSDRRYVSIEGPVGMEQPPAVEDLVALDERYARTDFSSGWDDQDYAGAVMLVLRPERWVAWSDWD